MTTRRRLLPPPIATALACALTFAAPLTAHAETPQEQLIAAYATAARTQDGAFADFSAARGLALFTARPGTGKPDTPSCTTCHTTDPAATGQTRAGKAIAPMALSKSPERYSDAQKAEKWFLRNCTSVLGRECTPQEKGDFLTFMTGQ